MMPREAEGFIIVKLVVEGKRTQSELGIVVKKCLK